MSQATLSGGTSFCRLQGNTSIVNLTDLSTTAVSVGLGARTICSAAMQQTLHVSRTGGDETSQPRLFEKEVLYRGRWMVPFRVLVRLKIFQLAGVASLAIPLNSFLLEVSHILAQHSCLATFALEVKHNDACWLDLASLLRINLWGSQ